MTSAEWQAVWAKIRGGWAFAQLADPVVEAAWRSELIDLEADDLVAAVSAELRSSDRAPSIAALRRGANDAARDRRTNGLPKLTAPVAPIPERYRGGWHTVAETLARQKQEGGAE